MRVVRVSNVEELANRAKAWDALTRGIPFRSWGWVSAWWKQYGNVLDSENSRNELYVLCVVDNDDTLLGVAPWYMERSLSRGRVIRFLGSGEVCSDYLSILTRPGLEGQVADVMAEWLVEEQSAQERWDMLELTGVDAQDEAVNRLVEHLRERGTVVDMCDGLNCWRLDLPGSWDEYLARLSRSHRKRVRREWRKWFDTGRAVYHTVQRLEELPDAMELLIDLHQRRRRTLGDPGCFASERFEAFHRDVANRMLRVGQLQIHWLEIDGRPAAIEYGFVGNGVSYVYQSGVDPNMLDKSPGLLLTVAMIKGAIEKGSLAFDFLRGDEPYKPHFRAEPRPSVEVRVAAHHASAKLRRGIRLAGNSTKQWVKSGLAMVGAGKN